MGYIAPKKILAADASFAPYPIIPEQTGNCVTYLDLVQFGKLTEFTEIGVIGGATNPSSPDDFSIDPIDIGDAENTQITQSANKQHWTTFFNVISDNIKRLKLMHDALKEKIEAYDPPKINLTVNDNTHIITPSSDKTGDQRFDNYKNDSSKGIKWNSLNSSIYNQNIEYVELNENKPSIRYYLKHNYNDPFVSGQFELSTNSNEITKGNSITITAKWKPNHNQISGIITADMQTYKIGVTNVTLDTYGRVPKYSENESGIGANLSVLHDGIEQPEKFQISITDNNNNVDYQTYVESSANKTLSISTSVDVEKITLQAVNGLSNILTINVIDNTYACWYIGTSIPSGEVPINSNLGDGIGWRNVKKNGDKISYSNLIGDGGISAFNSSNPIWDGAANPIIINSNSGTDAYICIPFTEEMIVGSGSRATVKILIRDTDEDQLQNWVMQTEDCTRYNNTNIYYKKLGTNNKHKFIIYKATNIKIFNGTIF